MGKQRDLLDKTFRQQQGQADPKDGGAQGLQKQQNDLEKQLQDSLKGMDGKSAEKMREAGKAMGEAGQALGRKDMANAGSAQNQALDACARARRRWPMKRTRTASSAGGKEDPLGRSGLAAGQYRHQDSGPGRSGAGARNSGRTAPPRRPDEPAAGRNAIISTGC